MIDFTYLILAVITVISAIVTRYLIPYIKSKTTEKTREDIQYWIKVAVNSAEQIFCGNGRGEEKKQYVLDFIESIGITMDTEQIIDEMNALIESAVYELNK